MPTFQRLLDSIRPLPEQLAQRLGLIRAIEATTGRPLVVYAANLSRAGLGIPNTIDVTDITGFSDLIEDLPHDDGLDVFLHSPGGSPEATERLVNLLRANYDHVRFLVPHSAYSAATMFALAGDEILMDDRSSLGPIDPQLIIQTQQGIMSVPAQDILDGFKSVRDVLRKEGHESLPAFLPMLNKLDLHLFEICKNAQALAASLTRSWLEAYMFKGRRNRKALAKRVTTALSSHRRTLSHARTISLDQARVLGLVVTDLREQPALRDRLWQLYCLYDLYFGGTQAVKVFENSHGVSFARNFQPQPVFQIPITFPPQPPAPSDGPPDAPPA